MGSRGSVGTRSRRDEKTRADQPSISRLFKRPEAVATKETTVGTEGPEIDEMGAAGGVRGGSIDSAGTNTFLIERAALQRMGFTNQQANTEALRETRGDIEAAVGWLVKQV